MGDKKVRDMLVGIKTGLDALYDKDSEEELYLEYSKSIEHLNVDKDNKLKSKFEGLELKISKNLNFIAK